MTRLETTDDLDALMQALPVEIVERVRTFANRADLLEIVMDLGRRPEARFTHGEELLLEREVAESDIAYVIDHIGAFGDDNRAGIERTLHRISAIRNRAGKVVGLTCRIGRAVFGTIDIIRDIVDGGQSVLLLGRPGVGKTTMLREVARVLADDLGKRVIVVDTSNEIAGDGDIPHPGIGDARRMQVRTPTDQHGVMIEAVENHMPEVIVIDEIGTELEAGAARTIAERGVQLVGTAHGNTLDNLMLNPTLSDLIGGIQPVTLGDEEARRRGTQKTVLERKAPPTFDVVVEIVERDSVIVHRNVAETVDAILRGHMIPPESRWREGSELRAATKYDYRISETAAGNPAFSPLEPTGSFGAFGRNRGGNMARHRPAAAARAVGARRTRGRMPGEKLERRSLRAIRVVGSAPLAGAGAARHRGRRAGADRAAGRRQPPAHGRPQPSAPEPVCLRGQPQAHGAGGARAGRAGHHRPRAGRRRRGRDPAQLLPPQALCPARRRVERHPDLRPQDEHHPADGEPAGQPVRPGGRSVGGGTARDGGGDRAGAGIGQSDGAGSAERLHPAPAAPDGGAQQRHVALPRHRAEPPGRAAARRGAGVALTRRGRFITLEGSEGSGKTTAARHLGEWLRSRGERVVVTREPGGTPLGDEVRRLVLHLRDVSDDLDPRADALLYAAARAQHTARVIQPALERGEHVISARYLDSSLAYQGVAYGNDLEEMRRLQSFATFGLLPDLTILIDVPVEVGLGRKRAGAWNRFEDAEDVAFFEKVRGAYLDLAAAEPDRFRVVDGSGTVEDTDRLIRDAVEPLLAGV